MATTSHSEPDQQRVNPSCTASPVKQDANSPAGGEQWYFRIDGKNFGPSSRSQLEHFLRPPRLCKTLEVMCTDRNGYWLTIGIDETIDTVLPQFGIPLPSNSSTATTKPKVITGSKPSSTSLPTWISKPIELVEGVLSNLADRLGPSVKKFGAYIIIALALFIIGSTAFVMMGGMRISESKIVAQYDTIWNGALAMTGASSSEQWRQFADKALLELEPTLRDLSQSSSVQNSSRQQLLFAGRDHLKKMLKADQPPQKFSISARVYERYMALARKNLRRG